LEKNNNKIMEVMKVLFFLLGFFVINEKINRPTIQTIGVMIKAKTLERIKNILQIKFKAAILRIKK
jgi:hypothetical protein